ncbi:unnamed protein product [Danaus chrysippus]|uniref:(African queen) hypothetical protein n=1 Tax=Danaus chrysippus TaxID=151541 RepID=A0A8J2MG09_9NEOP|nr:unnamed protein product [Danaus chrysippus]
MVGVETLSDHSFIRFEVASQEGSLPPRRPGGSSSEFPRWSRTKLERQMAVEASIVQAWTMRVQQPVEVDGEARNFRRSLWRICDASMPRVVQRPPRRQVYWWTSEIAQLRTACTVARRQYTRQRRRHPRNEAEEGRLRDAYNEAKNELRHAICRSKKSAREELLARLDDDPWGRPYLGARNKIRAQTAPVTESLELEVLRSVVGSLFPAEATHTMPAVNSRELDRSEAIPAVTLEELERSLSPLRAKKTAPGPDGVPGCVLALALGELAEWYLGILNGCLRTGRFPSPWKEGRLVLLRKAGRPADSPSAYRPIVLLDDAGKLFERILASRVVQHISRNGPELSECQFGFRGGRSTIDAILRLRSLTDGAVSGGGVALAVSLDITNAFNSLPFGVIEEALRFHRLPLYIRRIIGNYLRGREISFVGVDGRVHHHEVRCGVPQGSVLGPLLWNLGYDFVLRGALPTGLSVVCYADDTLVVARGDDLSEAKARAEAGAALIVRRIEMLGLRVGLGKTEALLFHGPRARLPTGASINICGVPVELSPRMKYLGLTLDGKWNFREHFRGLVPRLLGTANALGRLLPNLGGPSVACRRLYTGVLRSMALYGAPVWAGALTRPNVAALHRVQRVMAVRVVRGYRTVSHEAACVLAGTPPWELDAQVLSEVYHQRARVRSRGPSPDRDRVEGWRRSLIALLLRRWKRKLSEPVAGLRTVEAIRPLLKEWVDRRHGSLTFRLVQILSGHGCFGRYLCHIVGREPTAACHHCSCMDDTADHTLAECPAWAVERRQLSTVVGADLSLPAVVQAMVGSERAWEAMVKFCEHVMSRKEAVERVREDDPSSAPLRRRRLGRRQRAYARDLPPQ